jgi:hypothetical protein
MATESFFSNASLAYLASAGAGKDGKTYSIKPTDGSGDFTFSRGSNLSATRVGPTGLIEKGRENLLLQSNAFSTSPWTDVTASVTSGQTGYDGSNDAWLLEKSGSSGRILQSISAVSGVYTYSVYAKEGASNSILLLLDASADAYAYFNLSAGTLLSNSNIIDGYITDAGNGWYRVSVLVNISSFDRVRIYPAQGADTSATTGSIYIQDAQVEIGLAATDYIESGATTGKAGLLEDEPRFDYSGGATCPSLLLEPSRTQLAKYSEALNIAPNVIDNATYLYNEIASPSGLTDAPKFEETTANDRHGFYQYVIIADGAVTASVFTKQIDRRYIHFQSDATGSGQSSYVDLQDGSVVSEGTGWTLSAEDYGNGWWRISATATAVAGNRYFIWGISLNGTTSTYVGDGSEFTFWGLQVEQASYPTSYIPNHSGGSVTRGGEFSSGGNDIFGGVSEGAFFFEFQKTNKSETQTAINLSNDGSQQIRLHFDGGVQARFRDALNGFANIGAAFDAYTNAVKVVLNINGSTAKVYLNGAQLGSDYTITTAYTFKDINLSDKGFILKQHLFFSTPLSDADCITLTT